MAVIPIRDIPGGPVAPSHDNLILIDDGTGMHPAVLAAAVKIGRPSASQGEAEGGADNEKVMTSLRVAQAITAQGTAAFAPIGAGLPSGGDTGEVLVKASSANHDAVWEPVEAATAVSYGPQALDDGQQAQARENIAAAPVDAITPFVAYTPTLIGFGAASINYCLSRRVANVLEVMARFWTGTGTTTEARMTLGFNGINGGLAVGNLMEATGLVGFGTVNVNTANQPYVIASAGEAYVKFSLLGSTLGGFTARNGNDLFGDGTAVSIKFSVPIEGW